MVTRLPAACSAVPSSCSKEDRHGSCSCCGFFGWHPRLWIDSFAAPAPRAALAANSAGIAFEVPSVVDPMHAMGEPDIGVDPLGRVFSSGPTGTGTQRSLWYGSVDKGHTYRQINPGTPPTALSGTKDAPGGGDTDIAFDRNSKQYFSDLYALTCLRTATTNDGCATEI